MGPTANRSVFAKPWTLAYGAVMAVMTVLIVVPWTTATLVPAMDYPAHLALVNALHHIGDTGTALGQHFVGGTFPAPNSMFYILTYALSFIVDLDIAGRIVVGALLILAFWGITFFATTFGRSRWFGLVAVPVLVQWTFTEGFLDYYLGVSLLLIALAQQHRYLLDPSRRRAVGVSVLGLLVFFAHVQALLFYAVGTCILLVLHLFARRTARMSLRQLAIHIAVIGAPVLVVTAIWLLGQQSSLEGALTSSPTEWIAADEKAMELLSRGLFVFNAPEHGELFFAVILGLPIAALTLRLLNRHISDPVVEATVEARPDDVDGYVGAFFVPVFALVCLLAFALAPLNMGHYWNFHSRILTLAIYLVAVAVVPAVKPAREWIALVAAAPLFVVAAYAFGTWSSSLGTWNAYADGFTEVLAHAPSGGHLLYIPEAKGETGFRSQVWRHLGQYQTAFNDGTTTFSFGFQPGRIIRERQPKLVLEYGHVEQVTHMGDYGCFDVILYRGPTHIEEEHAEHVTLLHRVGQWAVYAPVDRTCHAARAGPR